MEDHTVQAIQYGFRGNGFSEELGYAAIAGGDQARHVRVAGHHDDRKHSKITLTSANFRDELQAVDARHVIINVGDIDWRAHHRLEPLCASWSIVDMGYTCSVQHAAQNSSHLRIVIDDQNPKRPEITIRRH